MKKFLRLSTFLLVLLLIGVGHSVAQTPADGARGFGPPDPDQPVGLVTSTDQVADGYVLVATIQSKNVFLISNDGRIVNIWEGDHYLGASAYLLDNGNLLRTSSLDDNFGFGYNGQFGFIGGRIEERTWDNELVWEFEHASEKEITHHDIERMPNGHILMTAFERFTAEEAIAAGFNPENLPEVNEVWGEKIIEVDPETNEIVWEWRLWDHLIQDFDDTADNYGVVADHPELININYHDPALQLAPNWWHVNSVDYNAELDLIMISPRTFSEMWIIDHSVTTEEARGEAGHLLYRWGNPAAHDAGTNEDRTLYYQHDPRWILDGYPGAGNILIYNNGGPDRFFTDILEITLPVDDVRELKMEPGQPTSAEIAWRYFAPEPSIFYSSLMSGSERQLNGNTLITEGLVSHIFEVTPDGEIAWAYYLPPATWIFRAERYDLPIFDTLDMTADLPFEGGEIWGIQCVDGTQPLLYEYNFNQNLDIMQLYIQDNGEEARAIWEIDACLEHGGLINTTEDGTVWGDTCADGTRPYLHRGLQDDREVMEFFTETHGDNAQQQWETEACAEHGGLAD
jgi:hypothetical protein